MDYKIFMNENRNREIHNVYADIQLLLVVFVANKIKRLI